MIVGGNYDIQVRFGGEFAMTKPTFYPIDMGMIQEIVITQDLEKVLPTLRMVIADPTGILTHIQPFDSSSNTVEVSFAEVGKSADDANTFTFTVYRKKPLHAQGSSGVYDISGMLAVKNYYAPSHIRCSEEGQTVASFIGRVLEDLAGSTGFLDSGRSGSVGISRSLQYEKMIYQPNWTNAELLMDLKRRLRGQGGEACFKIFLSMHKTQVQLNVRSWNELVAGPVKYVFVFGDTPHEDIPNIFNCQSFDNYMLLGACGVRSQRYGYFDYAESEYRTASVGIDEMPSLTEYHFIDGSDADYSDALFFGDAESADAEGKARTSLYERASNLSKLWADMQGMHNLQPGDIVQIVYGLNIGGDPSDYQYGGLWLVERVVHIIQNTYFTRVLLTRNGMDTARQTTLLKAEKSKSGAAGIMGMGKVDSPTPIATRFN